MDFLLKKNSEYIELAGLLKVMDIVNTGGEAKHLIREGEVTVNGEVETRKKAKIRSGSRVEVLDKIINIS